MRNFDERFQNELQSIKEVNFEQLKRLDLGIPYNFEEAADKLNLIAKNLIYITDNRGEIKLPQEDLDRLIGGVTQLSELIKRIVGFNPADDQNANGTRKTLQTEVDNFYQEDLRRFEPIKERMDFLHLNTQALFEEWNNHKKHLEEVVTQLSAEAKNLESKKQEFEVSTKEQQETVERAIEESKTTLQEIRNSLGQHGASISNTAFEKQADSHKALARIWLLLSLVSVAGTLLLIIGMFNLEHFKIVDYKNPGEVISNISYKLLVLSVAYLTIKQSIKNYRVNLHLHVLNKHRQLTLEVYPLMVGANSNPDQSNTIVSQASKAIFDMGSTGHLEREEPSTTPVNLTEVITKIIDSKS